MLAGVGGGASCMHTPHARCTAGSCLPGTPALPCRAYTSVMASGAGSHPLAGARCIRRRSPLPRGQHGRVPWAWEREPWAAAKGPGTPTQATRTCSRAPRPPPPPMTAHAMPCRVQGGATCSGLQAIRPQRAEPFHLQPSGLCGACCYNRHHHPTLCKTCAMMMIGRTIACYWGRPPPAPRT